VFAVIGLWPLVFRFEAPRWWSVAVALVFLTIAWRTPRLLAPLNRVWFRLGLLLHHAINPVVMGLLYGAAIIPIGLFLRASGKDLLRLKRDHAAKTYWISREPPGPARGSMSKQF